MLNLFMAGVALQPRCELLNGVAGGPNEVAGRPVAVGDGDDLVSTTLDNSRSVEVPSV